MSVTGTAVPGAAPKVGVTLTLTGVDLDTVNAIITVGLANVDGRLTAAQLASLQAVHTAIQNAMA